ncbi:MAG: S8 family peptidase, partial [Zoogloea sp.]|uniref:S8 family peptidase n=1 Tax=Zoogloea sp. TaxID=49181 RepID=UPI003F30A08B
AAIAAANINSPFTTSYGGYKTTAGSVISVAPNANIVAEKVLNSAGSGYSTDVANGVKKAADAGAAVINVSITYGNTSDIVAAINYATAKGAIIVWAGGNSSVNLLRGANTTGLTATAISRLIFAGSVSATNTLSSFSNKPGTGSLVNTANAATSYASRWIMTPGENIVAPYVTAGSGAWAYWSGTSMSAPIVSGSLILLESAWPILKTNGTAANLLLATAKDLGSAGVDSTYGAGLANLTTAFQPYGALTVTKANGQTATVSSLTGAMISSGALGTLSSIQSKLAAYTAFDSYTRNFSVNLANLIKSPPTAATLNPLPSNTRTAPTAIKLADGGELAYWSQSYNARPELGVFDYNADTAIDKRMGYAMYTDPQGRSLAFGFGFPVQFAFAKSLYGHEDLARLSEAAGISTLSSLAQGGGLAAWGMPLNEATRVAVSWSGTSTAPAVGAVAPSWSVASANNMSLGLSHRFNAHFTGGVSYNWLNENHGLLGSTYDTSSLLSLGERNQTRQLTLSAGFTLNARNSLLVEAGFATTRAASANSLFAGTSELQSRSWAVTFMSREVWRKDDRLMASVRQPLRLESGAAALVNAGTNADGTPSYSTEWVSLSPSGRQIDYKLAYDLPLSKQQTLNLQTTYRRDYLNIAGNNDVGVGANWSLRF